MRDVARIPRRRWADPDNRKDSDRNGKLRPDNDSVDHDFLIFEIAFSANGGGSRDMGLIVPMLVERIKEEV